MLFDGLCGFRVKNEHRKKNQWRKKRGCGEKRGGCGEKVENSGEKVKNSGEKKKHHLSLPAELLQVYQTWPGQLGYPRELGPELIECPLELLRTLALAVNKAQEEADQITTP
jgi:hypothetical protein